MDEKILSRMLVTDLLLYGGDEVFVANVVSAARDHGATAIILREKELATDRLTALARDLPRRRIRCSRLHVLTS